MGELTAIVMVLLLIAAMVDAVDHPHKYEAPRQDGYGAFQEQRDFNDSGRDLAP
jgi:hypothetical protein